MSQRTVLILAALTALLVGYVLVFERTSVTSKELEQRKGRVLSSFVRERVDRLELQRHGQTVVLERKPLEEAGFAAWQMLEPVRTEADQDAVDQVLGELEWLSARRTIEQLSAADQKAFGLSAPRYRVWYRIGNERHVLVVGNSDVHGQAVYVRTEDPSVAYVVPKTLTDALEHNAGHFRSKSFLGDIVIAWARSVELERAGQKLVLTHEGDHWWYEGSPRGYADPKRIEQLLTALDDLKATRYPDEGPVLSQAKLTLAQPQARIQVRVVPDEKREDQTPRQVELRLGGSCPDHPQERLAQAGSQGSVVCVSLEELKPFEADFAEFRLPGLLSVDASRIEAFELTAGARKLALKRDGENWLAQQANTPVDRETVELWLMSLSDLRATGFEAPATNVAETGRLTLTLAGDKREDIALFPGSDAASVRVRRGDEPLLSVFPARLTDLLDPAPRRFASLLPWQEQKPSEIVALEARAPEKLSRALTLESGAWSSGGKPLAAPAELRVRELVKDVLKTRALGFVSEHARTEQGLATPRATLVLNKKAVDGKNVSPLRLALGADSARGLYARFDEGPVYELDRRVLAVVQELAGGARVPEPAPPSPSSAPGEHDEEDEELEHHH